MIKKTNEYFSADFERLLCLLVLLAASFFLYGTRTLLLAGIAFVTAFVCDLLMRIARANCYTERDLSSYVIALTITLMLPASIDYTVVITSTVVAVLVAKYAFGGLHHYPFNPAAVGFTVALVSWPERVFVYPVPFSNLPLTITGPVMSSTSLAATLKNGGLPSTSVLNILTGNYAGPMGATFVLIILSAAILLCIRKRISFILLFTFLVATSILIVLFPRVTDASALEALFYELSSGTVLFSAVFIVPDKVCTPRRTNGRIIYAIALAVVSTLFRYIGAFEIGICFAVIIVSALSGFFDSISSAKLVKRWIRRRKEVAGGK